MRNDSIDENTTPDQAHTPPTNSRLTDLAAHAAQLSTNHSDGAQMMTHQEVATPTHTRHISQGPSYEQLFRCCQILQTQNNNLADALAKKVQQQEPHSAFGDQTTKNMVESLSEKINTLTKESEARHQTIQALQKQLDKQEKTITEQEKTQVEDKKKLEVSQNTIATLNNELTRAKNYIVALGEKSEETKTLVEKHTKSILEALKQPSNLPDVPQSPTSTASSAALFSATDGAAEDHANSGRRTRRRKRAPGNS